MYLSRCGVEIASVIGAAKHFAAVLALANSDRLNGFSATDRSLILPFY